MNSLLFSKPKKTIGVDIGAHSVKAVQMSKYGGRLRVEGAGYALVDRSQYNTDAVTAQAIAAREALRNMNVGQCLLVGALPGQTVVIRYPRLSDMPHDRIAAALEKEAGQHIPYDLSEVFLDWTLLDSVKEGNERRLKVLLVAAKHEVIEARVQIATAADMQFSIMSVDSLALADAAESCDFLRVGETVALVNIGLTSASIHFVKDGVSNFIRDVNWGARELIQAIARGRRVDYERGEALLTELSTRGPKGPPVAEKTVPGGGSDAPIEASSKPRGRGASLLDPLDDELGDVGEEAPPTHENEGDRDPSELVSGPLTRLVSEIRRSFDYYEHELYESPVGRLILSGGVAHLPILSETLSEELGLKSVEVANPAESALFVDDGRAVAPLRERPAQFLVAVGLAARGTAAL